MPSAVESPSAGNNKCRENATRHRIAQQELIYILIYAPVRRRGLCLQGTAGTASPSAQKSKDKKHRRAFMQVLLPAMNSSKRSTSPGRLRCGLASGEISAGWSSTKVGCWSRGSTTCHMHTSRVLMLGQTFVSTSCISCTAAAGSPASVSLMTRAVGTTRHYAGRRELGWVVWHDHGLLQ